MLRAVLLLALACAAASLKPGPPLQPVPPYRIEATGDPAQPAPRTFIDASMVRHCLRQKAAWAAKFRGKADVVLLGDSILEALSGVWCYQSMTMPEMEFAFSEAFTYYDRSLVMAGAGDQTPHTLYMMSKVVPILKSATPPKVFFVMIGTNNIGVNCSRPRDVVRGVTKILRTITTEFPTSQVLLHPLLPRADDVDRGVSECQNFPWQRTIDNTNTMLHTLAQGNVHWVDCSEVFPRGNGPEALALMPDLLHPNAKGYRKWFQCLDPHFGQLLGGMPVGAAAADMPVGAGAAAFMPVDAGAAAGMPVGAGAAAGAMEAGAMEAGA